MHDRGVQLGREAHRRSVEGVIVDDVVPLRPDGGVDGSEGGSGRTRSPADRTRDRAGHRPVQGGCQRPRIDPRIDDRDPVNVRSGSCVDVDLVAAADQAARQVCHEGLRAAALWFADGRHEWGDDPDLHAGITLKARSRGGLMPRTS